MPDPIDPAPFAEAVQKLFEELFERHHGLIFDRGTSLFETLSAVDAARASLPMGPGGACVAAHVAHLGYYLEVLERCLFDRDFSPANWRAIWNDLHSVTPSEWEAVQAKTRATYLRVKDRLQGLQNWNENDAVGFAMAMIAHTASHLGAIRQGLRTLPA